MYQVEAGSAVKLRADARNSWTFDEALASQLREAGIANTLYTEPDKIAKKMRYADKLGFAYAVQIGQREVDAGQVTVKDMRTGETATIALDALVEHVSN